MKRLLRISLLLFLGIGGLQAQTTNLGKLSVKGDTKFSTLEEFDNRPGGEFLNDGEAYLYSHLNNDGVVDYLQETGLTLFIGTTEQEITGSEPIYLYDVYFDNPSTASPFHLLGWLNMGGEVNFYQGIVDNKNYGGRIDFETNAYAINTADISHVNGMVGHLGDQGFTFPIGKQEYYRMAAINGVGNADGYFNGEYFLENSNDIGSHSLKPDAVLRIDDQQYWTVVNESTPENNVFLTLSLRDATTPSFIMNAASDDALTIVRWDPGMNMWVDEGGTVDHNDQTVTTRVNGFGVFALATLDLDNVEPCHIVVYNAVTPNGDGINDYFRIDNQGECAQNLKVQIFNRWGRKIFQTDNYGPNGDVFDGYSSGRLTVRKGKKQVPTGTYFYILEYDYEAGSGMNTHQKAGYLYVSGN